MSEILDVRDLHVNYGKLSALRNVNFAVSSAQIVSIIGPNGAGKSTLLKALMGMLRYRGKVTFDGQSLDRASVETRVQRGLLLVPETRELFAHMSVADNLALGAYLHRHDRAGNAANYERVYNLFPRLKERSMQMAGSLSGGERQMLALARALMGRPRLLMLDEPSLGLAPLIVAEILRVVTRLREMGVTILLVEQNARAALEIADYGYVLEVGDVAHHGPADELLRDPKIVSIYLGRSSQSGDDAKVG